MWTPDHASELHERDPLQSPFTRYIQHGSSRPSKSKLESSLPQLLGSSKLNVALVAGDMCLDLAIADQENAPAHLEKASEVLDNVISIVSFLDERGYEQANRQRHNAMQARLRQSEMGNWRRAAAGEHTENQYHELLKAAMDVDPLNALLQDFTKLIEFMPILLGARARHQEEQSGWLGRLSLAREERKGMHIRDLNPNWDTGIVLSSLPEEFSDPVTRLQIKARRQRRPTASTNARVIPLLGRAHGIARPAQIIYSCWREVERLPSGTELPFDILSPAELDSITGRLRASIIPEAA